MLKEELNRIETSGLWQDLYPLLKKEEIEDPEIYMRSIFILLDLLVDGNYSQEEHDLAAKSIKEIYADAESKFSDHWEFQFFAGIMICIAEWYFDVDSIEDGYSLLEKAMNNKPGNGLTLWGYYSRIDQRVEVNSSLKFYLCKQLFEYSPSIILWLEGKGLLGKYVLGTLEDNYSDLKQHLN